MEIKDYPEDMFWEEAKRRYMQRQLVPDPRTEVMGYVQGGTMLPPQQSQFPAVCSSCRKPTTVPFRPNPNKPVYCLECYRKGVGQ